MSKVICFSTWKIQNKLVVDCVTKPDECDDIFSMADLCIDYLLECDCGENGPVGQAADIMKQLLFALREAGECKAGLLVELQDTQGLVVELRSELEEYKKSQL